MFKITFLEDKLVQLELSNNVDFTNEEHLGGFYTCPAVTSRILSSVHL